MVGIRIDILSMITGGGNDPLSLLFEARDQFLTKHSVVDNRTKALLQSEINTSTSRLGGGRLKAGVAGDMSAGTSDKKYH